MRMKIGDEYFELYTCGFSHCRIRIYLPGGPDLLTHPHRDLNGLRCSGHLVKFDLTKEHQEDTMAWAWKRRSILERFRKDKGLPSWWPVKKVLARMRVISDEEE